MKRLTIRLAIALTTFTLGISATAFYLLRHTPGDLMPLNEPSLAATQSMLTSCFPGLSIQPAGGSSDSYFPLGVFDPKPERESFTVKWYSEQLKALGEPSLTHLPADQAESYRFLWLRSFHHPVAVRVWSSGANHFITVKQTSGAGGYEPGKLITDQTCLLSEHEWSEFTRLLEQACYWQQPTSGDLALEGQDGAQWILEGYKSGRYHVVDRWSPTDGDFHAACIYLLKISGLEINLKGEDVY